MHSATHPRNRGRVTQSGFSLIELLIVVAIILIVAAIAIPNFLRAKITANEASAVASVRTLSTAETAYATTYPTIGYSALLTDLGPGVAVPCAATVAHACLIDGVLAAGTKSGYLFTYVQDNATVPSAGYTINADPSNRGATGQRSFYTDQPGVIRFNPSAVATVNDPTI